MANKKTKNTGLVVTLLIVSLAGGAGIGAYVINTPDALHVPKNLRQPKPVSSKVTQAPSRLVPRVMKDGRVDFVNEDIKIPAGADERTFLLNDFLKQLHEHGIGDKGARVDGVDVRDRVAYVDFNRAFDESFGTMDEATLLNGVLRILGQFSDTDKVQFYVDGKPMETTGNVDLTQPQNVIRPGEHPTDSSMDAG